MLEELGSSGSSRLALDLYALGSGVVYHSC